MATINPITQYHPHSDPEVEQNTPDVDEDIEDGEIITPNKKRKQRKGDPISEQLALLRKEVGDIGKAVKDIHGNTRPAVSWLPSILLTFIIVYPLQQVFFDTAREYKVSAWASGIIADAKRVTGDYALGSGIRFAGGSTSFAAPLKGKLVVTSHFNPARKHPITGKLRAHNGTDYRCSVGDPVFAMRSGVVTTAKHSPKAGNMIILKHSNGETSAYMHLHRIQVRYKEKVSTGEQIGLCGETGKVTGPHLHVETRKADNTPMNPIKLVGITNPSGMWEYFKDTVAQSESQGSGDYKAVSKSGTYKGRYQMGRDALTHAGYKYLSWDKFMNDPRLQDRVYKAWQYKNLQAGRFGIPYKGLDGFINDHTPAYKVAGFLHASQFGVGNALRWYTKGIEFYDGNKKAISTYAKLGEDAFIIKYGRFASAQPLIRTLER